MSRNLRSLLASGETVIAPEATSALAALAIERAGFPAVYVGGGSLATTHYGLPDVGLVTPADFLPHVARICEAVDLPVICDIDQGSDHPMGLKRVIAQFERAGAAAVHVEDALNPKHVAGVVRLLDHDAYRAHIAAAVDGRDSEDFLVIARTDAGWTGYGDLDELIARGNIAAEAGADAFMAPLTPVADLPRLAEAVPIPLVEVNAPPTANPHLGIAIHCGIIARSQAAQAMELLAHLRDHGTFPPITEELRTLTSDLIGEARIVSEIPGAAAMLDGRGKR